MINEKEYNEAVKAYTKNIFRFVYKHLKDREAANDLVQDCFLKLWQNKADINNLKIKPWLFSVAHHAMINYIKTEARKTNLEDPAIYQIAVASLQEFDVKEIIERSLAELTHMQRSIILLRDLEGYSYNEIGNILLLNESQVKVYLFRARQRMKDSIKILTAVL